MKPFFHFSYLCLLFCGFDFAISCSGIPKASIPALPPSGGKGRGSHEGKCIHWDGEVTINSNETKPVHELAIGDHVLSYTDQYGFHTSPVVAILHRDHVQTREFVQITSTGGHKVSLTPEHGVHSGPCGKKEWKEKRADQVVLGECVITGNNEEESVVNIQSFMDIGAVKPITEAGSIVVNGMVVSCYDYGDQISTEQHEKAEPYRALYGLGEKLYGGLQESELAVTILDTMINYLGLDKIYA